ncbi:Retrovirus-related Pol polyprotein from transposon RE2 [Linum perenne]
MDRESHKILFQGRSRDGLYHIPFSLLHRVQPKVNLVTLSTWHRRLGHVNMECVKRALRTLDIQFSNKRMAHICHDCCVGKLHKQPFSLSHYRASGPLDLICSDVWGPSPIESVDGHKYYVIFYDHYSKYCWIYFLRYRSDLLSVFITFRAMVEKFFGRPICSFRADWGGEYQKLSQYLTTEGIVFQSSCPHTPEQNGCAERKHRHITELGRTLIHQAKLPLQYWPFAFRTAVYLVNRVPSSSLNNDIPFRCLFNELPDYTQLKVFGCLCYPWLKPYSANKLEPKSAPSAFLGYSPQHKGYYCLNLTNYKIHISRHVVFDELTFPFQEPSVLSSTPTSTCSDLGHLSLPNQLILHPTEQSPTTPTVDSIAHQQPQPPTDQREEQPTAHVHPMVTRSRTGSLKPRTFSVAANDDDDVEPTCFSQAYPKEKWRRAMNDEFNALLENNTWTLEEPNPHKKGIGNK